MTASHRIDELLFNLTFASLPIVCADQLRSLVVDKLLPLIEAVFDQFDDEDMIWQIDQLEVDVGAVSEAQLPMALAAELRMALEAVLRRQSGPALINSRSRLTSVQHAPGRRIARRRSHSEMLLAFLSDGILPWQLDVNAEVKAAASHQALLQRVLEQGAETFLAALSVSPHRAIMLARLTRQFASLQLQTLLRRLDGDQADFLLSCLTALQAWLQDAVLTPTLRHGAVHAAWEEAFAAGLDRQYAARLQDQTRQSLPQALMRRALTWLATQQGLDVRALAGQLLQTKMRYQRDDEARDDLIRAVRNIAGEAIPTTAASLWSVAIESGITTTNETTTEVAMAPAVSASIRHRVSAALIGGNAGAIYDDWHACNAAQPDLLRSALLHYGGYREIREKIAATFPLSLLVDMQALLAPEAAACMLLLGNDVQVRTRYGADGAAQWSQWQRHWWRGSIVYLLQAARAQEDRTATVAASAFNMTAYLAAALEGVGVVATDASWFAYLAPHAHTVAPATVLTESTQAQSRAQARQHEKAAALQTTLLTASDAPVWWFEAIRRGAQPLEQFSLSVAQLEQWVRDTVRDSSPSFYQAIVSHAASARNRHAYYLQILYALAQNRLVDLEQFAAIEEAILTPSCIARPQINTTNHAPHPAFIAAIPVVPSSASLLGEHDKQHLVARLAKAFIQGDAALLYGDWEVLLHKHPLLLRDALHHYGIGDDILERVATSFPESMLCDMAVLLAPAMAQAWSQLCDQHAWAALLASADAPSVVQSRLAPKTATVARMAEIMTDAQNVPTAEKFATWKRQLWTTLLRYLLRSAPCSDAEYGSTATVAASEVAVARSELGNGWLHTFMTSLAGDTGLTGLAWQHRFLARWEDLSVRVKKMPHDFYALEQQESARIHPPLVAAHTAISVASVIPTTVADSSADDIGEILRHYPRLSADAAARLPTSLSASVHADLLQRLTRLKDKLVRPDAPWTAADLERLVEACVLAQDAHQAPQQRQTLLQAIAAHAPSASAAERARYFTGVLQALLHEQTADLEKIAEANVQERKQANTTMHPVMADWTGRVASPPMPVAMTTAMTVTAMGIMSGAGKPAGNRTAAPHTVEQLRPGSQDYIDCLLSPDFRTGAAPVAGLVEWLRAAIDNATPDVVSMLTQLSRHPAAVARLLDLLPMPSWPQLATLALQPLWQVQRMRRYAGDIGDMFAELNRQLSATDLARFEWRFLLTYLFAPERIFDPVRFSGEWIHFLTRESGCSMPTGLAVRLRSQMGIVVATPLTASGPITGADARASDSANPVLLVKNSNSRNKPSRVLHHVTAPVDDGAVLAASASIFVANAGMVLAWPFLSRAWDTLGLTHEGKFIDEAAAQRAAWLLQFAVDEQVVAPEYQLTLNKLLCGIGLPTPIMPEFDIRDQERELIEELLVVIISHWKTLGNTSIRGLRETFLQRPGSLSRQENGWHLQVPKQTFDMLLEKLPWSIATIRLPWMEDILWVQWI